MPLPIFRSNSSCTTRSNYIEDSYCREQAHKARVELDLLLAENGIAPLLALCQAMTKCGIGRNVDRHRPALKERVAVKVLEPAHAVSSEALLAARSSAPATMWWAYRAQRMRAGDRGSRELRIRHFAAERDKAGGYRKLCRARRFRNRHPPEFVLGQCAAAGADGAVVPRQRRISGAGIDHRGGWRTGAEAGSQTPDRPDTDYGRSKWLAERNIDQSGCRAVSLRLSGLFGRSGPAHLGLNRALVLRRKASRRRLSARAPRGATIFSCMMRRR